MAAKAISTNKAVAVPAGALRVTSRRLPTGLYEAVVASAQSGVRRLS